MIKVENISLGYGGKTLVQDVSFTLEKGELVMLCGPNGSGKTTLLKEIARLYPALTTLVPTRIPKLKGFTARDFLRNSLFLESSPDKGRIQEALEALGLEDFALRDISTLSDGEFQKLCIAAGLVMKRPCLLLDEPTAFLDAENRVLVVDCLQKLVKEKGLTILFSSHDLHESATKAHRIFAISPDGHFHTGGPSTVLKAFPNIKNV